MQSTLVTPEGFAVASNGRLIACVQAKVQGLAHPAMVPQVLGPKSKADLEAEYHTNGRSRKCEKHRMLRKQRHVAAADVQAGRFPQVGCFLDKADTRHGLVLAINAHFLWRLTQAINVPDTQAAETVTLFIPFPQQGEVVTEAIGVLSNYDSRHGRGDGAGGFGVIMPCDATAEQARREFQMLREAAQPSIDEAAKHWSEARIERCQKEGAMTAVEAVNHGAPTETVPQTDPQPRRKNGRPRRRTVA